MDIRQEIITTLNVVKREGMDKIIEFLDKSDYFMSPASTKHHMSIDGGLAIHSYIVYRVLKDMNDTYNLGFSDDSITLIGLLHDICKVGCYSSNLKLNGETKSIPYKYNDSFPIGHGEKSVMILNKMISLSDEEMMAIRYHQGVYTYSNIQQWNIVREMIKKSGYIGIVEATVAADQIASQLIESNEIYTKKYIL